MEIRDLNTFRSIAELRAYQTEVRQRMTAMHQERAGLPFEDAQREEFAALREQDVEIDARVAELEARDTEIARIAAAGTSGTESEDAPADPAPAVRRTTVAAGSVRKPVAQINREDLFDLSRIRMEFGRPDVARAEFRDRALRVLEQMQLPAFGRGIFLASARGPVEATEAKCRDHIAWLIERADTVDGEFARRAILTSSPLYLRAFAKKMSGVLLSPEEERGLSLTTTEGGYAVPISIDPTVIPTSDLAINPWRGLASISQVIGNTWRGITAGAVTAAYATEGSEASDDAPTIGQPTITVVKADSFIPFTIELEQDWAGMSEEMQRLLNEAKDVLEADKFFSGNGTNEPTGLDAMSGAIDQATLTGGAFVLEDLTGLRSKLPPRYRSKASIVANSAIWDLVRGFDPTFGLGASGILGRLALGFDNQVPTPGSIGTPVIGRPAYEATAMEDTVSGGNRIALLGDFSRFKIADKVGMNIEIIPHLFHVDNNRPSGKRGLYAHWRNSAKPINESAFVFLKA